MNLPPVATWGPFFSGALYNLPSAVDGLAVVEGEEGFAVVERGSLAQTPQVVGQVAEVAGEVGVAPVDLSRDHSKVALSDSF